MNNPLHPTHLTQTERRRELCTLLARGLIRLHMRQNSRQSSDLFAETGESSLHICLPKSGDEPVRRRRMQ